MNAKTRKRIQNRRYGVASHKRAKAVFGAMVASGSVRCARGPNCQFAELVDGVLLGGIIEPGSLWDAGHDDYYPQYYTGPEHAKCNRGAPHRNVTSREW